MSLAIDEPDNHFHVIDQGTLETLHMDLPHLSNRSHDH